MRRGSHRTPPLLWAAAIVPVAIQAIGLVLWCRWRFLRCSIEGESMRPSLVPGDWVIADRGASRDYRPRAGDVVLASDPRNRERTLVKRVDHVDLHNQVWLAGDNPPASTDSRTFGAVPLDAVVGRVRWRYWPIGRLSTVV
jgi:nickel-type superoxide dismutase maturation protease